MAMKSFKSDDHFHVTGRGQIFVCHIPDEKDVPVSGERVLIDDKEYEVAVLERAMLMIYPPEPSKNVMICVK